MEEFATALREGDEGTVLRLLDADPTLLDVMSDAMRKRPLAVAAHHGHLEVVRLLIERGANISATGEWRNTALHYAAIMGYEEVVALLLDNGAHANSRNQHGITPLVLACHNGHLGVVRLLIQHMGSQWLDDRGNASGQTALHYAAHGGHEELLRFLLLAGADPTLTDNRAKDATRTRRGGQTLRNDSREACTMRACVPGKATNILTQRYE
jgi:ankyrin repeat protein